MPGKKSIPVEREQAANAALAKQTEDAQKQWEQTQKRQRCTDAVSAFGRAEEALWRDSTKESLNGLHEALISACATLADTSKVEAWKIADHVATFRKYRSAHSIQPAYEEACDLFAAALAGTLTNERIRDTWDIVALRQAFKWLRVFVFELSPDGAGLPGTDRQLVLPLPVELQPATAPPSEPPPAANSEFAELWQLAADKLKGIERRIVELICENGGACPLADLAVDPAIQWNAPFDDAFNSARQRIKAKIEKANWTIYRRDGKAKVKYLGRK